MEHLVEGFLSSDRSSKDLLLSSDENEEDKNDERSADDSGILTN